MQLAWTDLARLDFNAIKAYIGQDNPRATIEVVLQIIEKAESQLAEFTALGNAGRVPNTRELGISKLPYVIIYTAENDGVNILRIGGT